MAYSLTQIKAAHAAAFDRLPVHDARRDRVNHILASMLVYQMRSIGGDALGIGDTDLVNQLLSHHDGDAMTDATTTYSIQQLERAHKRVHDLAVSAPPDDKLAVEAHRQRVAVMDRIMASMFAYDKKSLDANELEPEVGALIDYLLK